METVNIALVEDDPVIRKNLRAFLGTNPALSITCAAASVEEALTALGNGTVADIILLDIGLPGKSGLEAIRPFKQLLPEVNVIMLTTYEEEDKIFKALCAGAVAYLSKRTPLPQIMEAVWVVQRGGSYMSPSIARKVIHYFSPQPKEKATLTARQLQIAQGIVDGLSYKLIADKYMISVETVRDHIKKIYRALNINSKSELVRKALSGELE
ncbi:MAG: response regulator transcription factor [Bacteroidota bacterium]